MKFISKLAALVALLPFAGFAQEVIPETVAENTIPPVKFQRQKIDGIIATVGDYLILDSDVDKELLTLKSDPRNTFEYTRCQILGKLMEDKLYAHQAIQDSVVVNDSQIRERMGQQIDYMVQQLNSMENVIRYFKKDSEEDFRSDMFEITKEQMLAKMEQEKIIDEVEITPEEVRTFFNKIPKEELPTFGAEMEIAQIVVKPKVSDAEKQKAIDRLKSIKKEVQEGASFFGKAVLYTDDKASSSTGGYYKINRKTQFVKEFKEVAFSTPEGEISEPFETEFGYHIIYVEKIRGQEIELRHILIIPKVSEDALKEAREKIMLIKKRIDDGEVSFNDAAKSLSDDKDTKGSGGVLTNPKTQDTRFELTKLDASLYREVSRLKDKEVSLPVLEEEQGGKKVFKIYTVANRYDQHTADYAMDYTRIKALALKEKQFLAVGKWFDTKIKDTYIKINAEYRDCEFTNNWLKK